MDSEMPLVISGIHRRSCGRRKSTNKILLTLTQVLHGEQYLELYKPLPRAGEFLIDHFPISRDIFKTLRVFISSFS